MTDRVRVVHYLNQFFAGIGGEARAHEPVTFEARPIGPGLLLQQQLGGAACLVGTIIGGDSYVAEEVDRSTEAFRAILSAHAPHVVVAGPAFDSGRYGIACLRVCQVATDLGMAAVAAMHPGNAAVGLRSPGTYIVKTTRDVKGMPDAIARMAALGLKLARKEPLGPAHEEGYLPTGVRRSVTCDRAGHERALDMLLAKLSGRPFRSELTSVDNGPPSVPAPPLADLERATLALITIGGLVPGGNPDRMPPGASTHAFEYPLPEAGFATGEWESVHGGFNPAWVNRHPDYAAPLDALRALVRQGRLGGIGTVLHSLTGVWTPPPTARRIAQALADRFRALGARGVLLVAT